VATGHCRRPDHRAGGQGERCTEGNVVSLGEACHAAIRAAHKLCAKTWPTALVQAVERLRLDYPLWGTRRVLIEQQQRRQRPLRLDQIGQCISVQDSEKRLNRIVQHAAQHADALDRAITAPPQTADNIELVLGLAHHLADIDVARRATQADAAPRPRTVSR